MKPRFQGVWLVLMLLAMVPLAAASELYFVDAHSQFDQDVDAELILRRMDEGGVRKTILASRRQRKPREAAELADRHPDRIVAGLRTKGRHYVEGTNRHFKKLRKQVRSGRFSAMAEVLVFHAQKGDKAGEVRVSLSDRRVLTALEYAIEQGWPFVIHIEFAALSDEDRAMYLHDLKTMLNDHPRHPFALIHMGQLPAADVAALLGEHGNLYFLTSHADPVSAADSKQPWINMMDGERFKPEWRQLITRYPDRFVFALDNVWDWQWRDTYIRHMDVWRAALAELPQDVAHAVAHGNAERLWGL